MSSPDDPAVAPADLDERDDQGWGEVPDAERERAARESWLLDERPPHWDAKS